MTTKTGYEIVGGEYGPQRVVFQTMREAKQSLAFLKKEYPGVPWKIISVPAIPVAHQ